MMNAEGSRPLAGIVIPTTDNAFFSSLADHAERCLHENGYASLICSSANNAEREKEYLRALASLGVRGILCVSGLSVLPEGLLPECSLPFQDPRRLQRIPEDLPRCQLAHRSSWPEVPDLSP